MLFSVLYGFLAANYVAFNGDAMRELAAQFLALAEKQGATAPLMIGHRLMGTSLLCTGDIAESRLHIDRAMTLYNPAEHRPLATRFGQTSRGNLSYLSWALWMLGYPKAALTDADRALATRAISVKLPLRCTHCSMRRYPISSAATMQQSMRKPMNSSF